MKRITTVFFLLIIIFSSCRKIKTKLGYYPPKPPIEHTAPFPRPDHIIIVIEENHGFSEVVGSENAPYINELIEKGALFTNSHGVTHPSQPNYLALFSGNLQDIIDNECLENKTPFTTSNLGASLLQNGFTFKGFAQTMPSDGYLGCEYKISEITNSYLYARKHAPWVNWLGSKENNIPDSLSVPMTKFPDEYDLLPTVSFVVPDMDNNMHNTGEPGVDAAISRGDTWLRDNLDNYIKWAQDHNSLFILTFDEDNYMNENQIPTLFIGPMVKPGKYSQNINHYNVFHTIEAIYGLLTDSSNNDAVIRDIWN